MISKIGLIGFGNMGSALLKGIRAHNKTIKITLLERDEKKAKEAHDTLSVDIVTELSSLAKVSEIIILAIKPQDAEPVLRELKTLGPIPLLSILAGKTTNWIQQQAGTDAVIRFMPSLSSACGVSAIGVCWSEGVSSTFHKFALEVAQGMGTPYEVPEALMGAVTGVSGSGIAYAFAFAHGIAMGGVKSGLSYQTSLSMALDMMEGAAKILRNNGENPVSMLAKVCSPAGTTIDGVAVLERGGFVSLCMDAVLAATERSRQLES